MSAEQHCILIADTSDDVILPLHTYFERDGAAVLVVRTMDETLQTAARRRPDIVLLAATLGDVDGVEIFRRLRAAPLTAHIPVMFIADFRDSMRQNELLAEGADDVIVRPFDVEILALRVRNTIKRTQREGLTDSITGLPSRALIDEKQAALAGQPGWSALEVALTNFDAFRARYDFITGNEVLRFAANTLSEIVSDHAGEDGFVGYPGEATFLALVPVDHAAAVVDACAGRLVDGLHQFYNFMEREQGFVQLEDGRGNMEERPLMGVQIARKDQ